MPQPELSIQPQGSLASLLGSLHPGPGGAAAPGALSLVPDFWLTAHHALQMHSFSFFLQFRFWTTLWLFPPSSFFPWNRLTLAKALTPNPALPDQNEPIPSPLSLPTPPHRTPVVGLRHALSHFPIDDSWIRPGEAPAARVGGGGSWWQQPLPGLTVCPQAQLSSRLSPESLLAP